MKKKHGIILICAALVLLSGCVEQTRYNPSDSLSVGSFDSKSNSSDSQSSSLDSQPGSSDSQSSSSDSQSGSDPNAFYSGTVSAYDKLNISNGDVLEIDDSFVCEKDGEINIEKGGVLVIRGDLDLSGDLYVCGKLIIEEDAKISGSGVIHVIDSFDDIECSGTVTAKIDAPEPVEIDGVTYVGGILLVNKKYGLPRNYGDGLCPEVSEAIEAMRKDTGFSMSLRLSSGYRSYETQEWWFNYYCETDGYENAITYSALPGHSEHQAGLAADITSTNTSYADTAEGKWLAANCYKYGLIIRYPADKVDITGYIYEPWHVRYLGKSTAKLVHDSGLCLEEFLEVDG
ncbi:MAG: D-alanyl-D-alanine carboxypeptidase family protein [Oscillospiraceae bacterium]|nr:D-alanyl-D-alanine carboxypeptidase family protein [Oscillospiraceae bacterium]